MKVITVFDLWKGHLRFPFPMKCLFSLFFLCLLLPHVNSQCKLQYGCIGRQKFIAYAPMIGPDGEKKDKQSVVNYKLIYLLSDKVVFYESTEPDSRMLEPETLTEEVSKIESRIERTINYGEIILDCGSYHNKLCHAQEYPSYDSIPSFKKVNAYLKSGAAEGLCLIIPFFENAYKLAHEKIAYICVQTPEELGGLLAFKHKLSRLIERAQLKLSNDRYSGFNGLLRRKQEFITDYNSQPRNVIAKLHLKGIILFLNDRDEKFVRHYSFYQQRLFENNVWTASQAIKKNKIDHKWYGSINPMPNPDCCLVFKGETENMVLCHPKADGTTVETASDLCRKKLSPFLGDVQIFLNGIKYAYAFQELSHKDKKLKNCSSPEYELMSWRMKKTIKYAIDVDCKLIFHYMKHMTMESKQRLCQQNYSNELALEHMLMGDEDKKILKALTTCVYQSKENKQIFTAEYFYEKLAEAKLYIKPKPSSFFQMTEVDDFEDEDGDAGTVKVGNVPKILKRKLTSKENNLDKDEVNLLQVKSSSMKSNNSFKNENVAENKMRPIKKRNPHIDVERNQVFRNIKMKELQKTHTWRTAASESITEKYDSGKVRSDLGSVDEFVNFLGFLGDSSKRTSDVIKSTPKKK